MLTCTIDFTISNIILTLEAPEATAVCAPLLDNSNILNNCRLTRRIKIKTTCDQK